MSKSTAVNRLMGAIKRLPDEVMGSSAKKLKTVSESLHSAEGLGIKGVSDSAKLRADRLAQVAKGKSTLARGRVGAAVVAGGAYGAYKVQKNHKDNSNQILNRIDSMYQ